MNTRGVLNGSSSIVFAGPPSSSAAMNFLTFKVVVVGEPEMGKTTLVQTIQSNKAPETGYKATIGVNYVMSTSNVGKRQVTLQLWDIAGQERLVKNLRMYYEHAYLALIVVSVEKAEKVLSGESSIEKQIEFFRSTDYVIPNSSRQLPLGLVISKWDIARKFGEPETLKKQLEDYGKSKGFEFTAFTSVFESDLTSVRGLKDKIVECCLELSSSQTLRIQYLGSTTSLEGLIKRIKPKYNPTSFSDSIKAGQVSLPLGKLPGKDKKVTLDIRPNNIPIKAPLYSEPNIVGNIIVISQADLPDKAAANDVIQRVINYIRDTKGMKIHNYDNHLKKCLIFLDNCSSGIGSNNKTLDNLEDSDFEIFREKQGEGGVDRFLQRMSETWNSIFEDPCDEGEDEVSLGSASEPEARGGRIQRRCTCGHS